MPERALRQRLDHIEQRRDTRNPTYRFTTTAGRTVLATIGDLLGVFTGGGIPPHLADVDGTREPASLAQGVVQAARRAREKQGAA
jgi:hypothetical protein